MERTGGRTEEPKVTEAVQGLVSDNLNRVEAQVDSTVESAKEVVHELRSEAETVTDQTLRRFQGVWGQMQEKLNTQMEQHPWLILGSLLLLGFVLSRSRASRRNA